MHLVLLVCFLEETDEGRTESHRCLRKSCEKVEYKFSRLIKNISSAAISRSIYFRRDFIFTNYSVCEKLMH